MAAPGENDRGEIRAGEVALPFDPAERTFAGVSAIGHLRTPWAPGTAPRNIRLARETGEPARIVLLSGFAPALSGLCAGQPIILMTWMDRARRDLVLQVPSHSDAPRGTFALRSPVRPNPIGLSTVLVTEIDATRGELGIDASDFFDGTPVLDIKPWLQTVDLPPGFSSLS